MRKDNLELLEVCGSALDRWVGPALVGADFNAIPQEVNATRVGSLAGARIRAPDAPRGTCTSSKKGRVIDFFLLSPDLAGVTDKISVEYATELSPHRPVTITFPPEISSLRARHLAKPQGLPTIGMIGPKFRTEGWQAIRNRLAAVREGGAGHLTQEITMTLLNHILQDMADLAEIELGANSGTGLEHRGRRCRGPTVTWRSILREKQDCSPKPAVSAKWAARLLADLLEGGLAEDGSGPRLAVEDLLLGERGALENASRHPTVLGLTNRAAQLAREAATLQLSEAKKLITDLQVEAAKQVEATTTEAEAEGLAAWKKWLDEDSDKGHRRAHSYVKIPEVWTRQEEVNDRGQLAADPITLLEATRKKFKGLWQAEDARPVPETPAAGGALPQGQQCSHLQELSHAAMREAARSFSHGTCATFDGLHPRGFDLMSDEALDAFGQLLMILEDMGQWPQGVDAVVTALIPKPKGGVRPIGFFSGLYRIWARVRRPYADQWEKEHDKPFFAARSGQEPLTRCGIRLSGPTGLLALGAAPARSWWI